MTDRLKRPAPLARGSRIAVISPSSPSAAGKIDDAERIVKEMGFEPVIYPSTSTVVPERGYLAGASDEMQIRDIHDAFSDPSIDGIICARGGSGAGRLIDRLDAELISAHPKVFAGYSDITIIHSFLREQCGLITFHAPMLTADQLNDAEGPNRPSFIRAVTDPAPIGRLGGRLDTIVPGTARGRIVGGNLSLLSASIGTRADFDTKGRILFIESVGSPPFRVDRMLTHLRSAGRLTDAAGIVFGQFTRCDPTEEAPMRTAMMAIRDIVEPLGIPCVCGLDVGHDTVNLTFPLGAEASLDATNGELVITSSALA